MTTPPQQVHEHTYGIIPLRLIPPPPRSTTTSSPPLLSTATTQTLLIHQKSFPPSDGATTPQRTYWSFPKGHAEPGDPSPLGTAIRELEEETGLVVSESDLLFPISRPSLLVATSSHLSFSTHVAGAADGRGDDGHVVVEEEKEEEEEAGEGYVTFTTRYNTPRKGPDWIKQVRYWVALLRPGMAQREIKVQEMEVQGARWCGWEEAREVLGEHERGWRVLREVGEMLDASKEGR